MTVLTTRICRGATALALALCGLLGVAAPSAVRAQGMGGMGMGGGPGGGAHGPQAAPDKPVVPAPDAVPGAKAREPAAPATRGAADMSPTDALFDAINRGDIAAARDALNRGADMNGVNVLGMTPMELSVDLGRNDISFLLLSMRGEDSDRGARALGRDDTGTKPPAPSKTARAARPASPSKAAMAANTQMVTRPITAPKLFANDGGAPVPSAGFLGFDSRSATN